MSSIYGPPVPAGSAEEPPRPPSAGPGGPGRWRRDGERAGRAGRLPHHRRGLVLTVAGVALAVAAGGTAWGLHVTQATPHKSARGASAIAAMVAPGVADIVCTLGYQHAISAGTGLVLTPSGEVLTNNHVVEGATSIKVTDVGNGRTYPASVAGYDLGGDVAVLHLRGASGLRTLSVGSAPEVTVGEKVIALGNAGGRGGTPAVVTGRVTGLGESITATDQSSGTPEQLTGLIRANAALQPGDSGGPLVTTAGQVIGLDTAGSAVFQFQPVTEAFAIPVGRAAAIAARIEGLRSSAAVHIGATGFLGVQLRLEGVAGSTPATEAAVTGILAGSPAARAGMTAGDVIVSVNGQPVSSPSSVQALLGTRHPGDKVSISWDDRAGHAHTATLVLATGPAG